MKSAVAMGGDGAACTVTFADAAASEAATDAAGVPAVTAPLERKEDTAFML